MRCKHSRSCTHRIHVTRALQLVHEAKTQLSRLVEQAARGREFVIAWAGKPMVRVVPLQALPARRVLGFLAGEGTISADVKADFAAEIDSMFGGSRRR